MNQLDKARATLSQMDALLSAKKSEGARVSATTSQYEMLQGRLAEAENRKADAVGHYQSALQEKARFGHLLTQPEAKSLIARTAALWTTLRRPESEWQRWLTTLRTTGNEQIKSLEPRWNTAQKPLPDFTLKDAQGKNVQLSMLKGKTTFIHVWAVWSSKHGNGLDSIQAFYDRIKDRPDLALLTLNADEYTEQIEGFLKERSYTFPVIPARRYLESFARFSGPAQSWIVDKTGTIRLERVGSGWGVDSVNETMKLMDQVARPQ